MSKFLYVVPVFNVSRINKVEVLVETPKTYTFMRDGERVKRSKASFMRQAFPTWAEAHEALVRRSASRVSRLEAELASARGLLEDAEALAEEASS